MPDRQRRLLRLIVCGLTAAVWTLPAMSHTGTDGGVHHGWLAGLLHPLTGMDHLAAMLAVGIWSALVSTQRWVAPLAFASVLLVGALAAQAGLPTVAVEPMIAVSLLTLGLLIAARVAVPQAVAAGLVAAFAWFHGAAHGHELAGHTALLGMVLSTAVLHGVGIGLGVVLPRSHAWAPRIAGAMVGAVGVSSVVALV
ncbi:MAG: HupE/UreJ family protein [Tepidimonas ignava]|uniref:HupE / UreJ protein n=1 Tax=Tepidimonas ignava TaxID=114249 RepID=A0A4V2UV67_9BURK|nr:HupE/UreJ family protein [Tepidimonas ignava]MCX7814200.1 HupE/UreJ family protein [Tepidimonas ignava]TCS94567.1 urease accessory protein [Tepidimonas ignava]TSE18793.1 HupE / UreJ protein [Tepidimonas ignava]